jgi:hypothetical protein
MRGAASSERTSKKKYKTKTTNDKIQKNPNTTKASRAELAAELAALGAVRLRGRWRAVDPAYVGQLLEVALLRCVRGFG